MLDEVTVRCIAYLEKNLKKDSYHGYVSRVCTHNVYLSTQVLSSCPCYCCHVCNLGSVSSCFPGQWHPQQGPFNDL